MDCAEAKTRMLAARQGTLPRAERDAVRAHIDECEECRREDAADAELSRVLDRLPKRAAPRALRESVVAMTKPSGAARDRRASRVVGILVLAAALAAIVMFVVRGRATPDAIVAEAVSDHLRILYSEHLVEIASGGIHQVKPWFSGRLDFAPVLAFAGDDDFPLEGGSVAYFIDRKAAAFVFKRRLHSITLFVFRSEGLPWSPNATQRMGRVTAHVETTRGFHVVTWRDGDLGYALVSDVDERELFSLGERIVAAK